VNAYFRGGNDQQQYVLYALHEEADEPYRDQDFWPSANASILPVRNPAIEPTWFCDAGQSALAG
jgi:hypothetical protein